VDAKEVNDINNLDIALDRSTCRPWQALYTLKLHMSNTVVYVEIFNPLAQTVTEKAEASNNFDNIPE